jgi:hypothetical protein
MLAVVSGCVRRARALRITSALAMLESVVGQLAPSA